jgi:hypothetical protein
MSKQRIIVNVNLYYKIKYYQILMMKKREFIIPDNELKILTLPYEDSFNLFKSMYVTEEYIQEKLSNVYTHISGDSNKKTRVIYVRDDESKKNILKETTEEIKKMIASTPHIPNVVLVIRVEFNAANLVELKSLTSFNIDTFLHRELFLDPSDNELNPKMTLLSIQKSKEILSPNLDVNNMRKLCYDDAVVKFLGGVPGQIMLVKENPVYICQVEETNRYRLIVNISKNIMNKKE